MSDSLNTLLEYLDGLTDRVDLATLRSHVEQLDITRKDLGDAAKFCDDHYARNLVSNGQWYEAVALCWNPGQSTPIHDHLGSSCCFRVIEGSGFEIGFERDDNGVLRRTHERDVPHGTVCASQDADIHEVGNREGSGKQMITLHIYSPPMTKFHSYTEGSAEVAMEELSATPVG